MPDDLPAAGDEASAQRAANARLRRVAEAKDAEIAALRVALEAGQARQAELITRLELRVAELERRLRMDSANSSTPSSKESLAAKARRKAAMRASQRERSAERKPGGQPGHQGVDGTFIWTPSHDQRPCSFSTALLRGRDPCRPEPRSRWSACSEARTSNLDGRRSSDEATTSRNVAERRATAAPDPPIWRKSVPYVPVCAAFAELRGSQPPACRPHRG